MNILTQVSVGLNSDAFVVFGPERDDIALIIPSNFHLRRFGKPVKPVYLRTLKIYKVDTAKSVKC